MSESGGTANASFVYAFRPPSISELRATIQEYDLPSKVYQHPYYSNEIDAPERPREYAGLTFHLKGGVGLATLEQWIGELNSGEFDSGEQVTWVSESIYDVVDGWEYASSPPSRKQTELWLRAQEDVEKGSKTAKKRSSQVRGSYVLRTQGRSKVDRPCPD